METSAVLFERAKLYIELRQEALDSKCPLTAEHYLKRAEECRKNALRALENEQLDKQEK